MRIGLGNSVTLMGSRRSAAELLLGGETSGLGLSAADDSMVIRDAATPANNQKGTPQSILTVARASTAWYWSQGGILVQASNDILRRDFDPRLGGSCGYLLEDTRTNLVTFSQAFDNAAFSKLACSISANQDVAPDGAVSMDRIVEDNTNAQHFTRFTTAAINNATAHTVSVIVKRGSRRYVTLALGNVFSSTPAIVVDLQTGAITSTNGTLTGQFALALPGGLWFIGFTATSTSAGTGQIFLGPNADGLWANNTYQGDGSSYISGWQLQFEVGSHASSIIPTSGASATRQGDSALIPVSAFPYNQAFGAIYTRYMALSSNSNARIAALANTSSERVVDLFSFVNGQVIVFKSADGQNLSGPTVAFNAFHKAFAAYNDNDYALSVDGADALPDTTASPIPTATNLYIGRFTTATLQLNGWITDLQYLNRRPSNAELKSKST